MTRLMILFKLVWAIWFLSEILINRMFRSPVHGHNDQDQGSLRCLWITILTAIGIGVCYHIVINASITHELILPETGLVLLLLGMRLRLFSIRALGTFFTVDVAAQTEQTLKTDGLCRSLRHPAYAGILLCFVGFGLSLDNWVSLPVMISLVFLAIRRRMLVEERVLMEQFGREYAEYMKYTARLIPGIY